MEKGFEALSQELQKVGTELYKATEADATKTADKKASDEAVEGEVVDEKKKEE